jgi:hypothetical protein
MTVNGPAIFAVRAFLDMWNAIAPLRLREPLRPHVRMLLNMFVNADKKILSCHVRFHPCHIAVLGSLQDDISSAFISSPPLERVCRNCISSRRREIFSSHVAEKSKISRSARDDKYGPFVHCETVSDEGRQRWGCVRRPRKASARFRNTFFSALLSAHRRATLQRSSRILDRSPRYADNRTPT